jgi:hypothetical protein
MASGWVVSGATLPDPDPDADAVARLETRFEHVAELSELVDALFIEFLRQRTDRTWDRTQRAMADWAAGQRRTELLTAAGA